MAETETRTPIPPAGPPLGDGQRRGIWSRLPLLELILLGIVLAATLGPDLPLLNRPLVQTFTTIFVSITVAALPFLVLGVAVSGAIAAFVPPRFMERALPKRPVLAVPTAGMAGLLLPGCECGSVPIAGRLVARGALPAAALTFLLSAPAINPVVLVATAIAFPAQPIVVVARFLASLITAVTVGLLWNRFGRTAWTASARAVPMEGTKWQVFRTTMVHDFMQAGGFLVIGAAAAATLQVVVPRSILDTLAGSGVVAIATMALLAVILSICSEADAFVAASLTQFSMTSRLVFMVVGPAVDLKLVAMQAGTFGTPFALRFAPLVFVTAVVVATLVGRILL
ncbi:MAG TPA: permease [Thermoanaerobaculia bacterium]|nr:permease [Thermoanaerobaculia bacterium]